MKINAQSLNMQVVRASKPAIGLAWIVLLVSMGDKKP